MLRQQLERSECVIDVHGGGVLKFGETHRELVRFLLDSTDKVIVRNNYMKQECLKRGVDLAKVFLVPCGIEVSNQTEMPEKQNIVVFCGALTPHKDPMTLLTAIPMVRERTARNIQFVFIGEGELKGRMLSIIEKNALGDLVKLFGALPNEKVRKCFQMAKILVLPSTRESFGIVLLEAMNCYTPCIVTNVGGMPELVDSDVGFVVEPGSPQAIADSIVRLLNDNELWEKKARLAYKRSLQYDMKNIGNLLVRALNIDNN
jgi:glycosyltransferase involved in cell wall biosynthesis